MANPSFYRAFRASCMQSASITAIASHGSSAMTEEERKALITVRKAVGILVRTLRERELGYERRAA